MIPIVLTPSEILAYHAGTLTEIRRPVEPQPDPAVVRADIVGPWCHFEDEAGPPDERGNREGRMWTERCPLGAPGDALYGQEVWGVGCRPDPFDGCRDGVEYQADESCLDDGDDLTLYSVEPPGGEDLCQWEGKGWQAAETMPEWASRIRLANRGVRVERSDVWSWCVAVEVQK